MKPELLLSQAQQTANLDDMIIYRSNPAQALLREREALESRSNLSLLDLMKCVVTTVPQSSTIAAQATRPDWAGCTRIIIIIIVEFGLWPSKDGHSLIIPYASGNLMRATECIISLQ